jgi:hypothetical protein
VGASIELCQSDRPARYNRYKPWKVKDEPRHPLNNALLPLGTCWQVHHEAKAIAYAACNFKLSDAVTLRGHLAKRSALVEVITINYRFLLSIATPPMQRFRINYCPFPALQRVEVLGCWPSFWPYAEEVLRHYYGRPDLEVVQLDPNGIQLLPAGKTAPCVARPGKMLTETLAA